MRIEHLRNRWNINTLGNALTSKDTASFILTLINKLITEVTYDPITIIIFILPLHYYLLPLVNKYTRNVLQYGHAKISVIIQRNS